VESALAQISRAHPQTKEFLESVLPIIQETANEARRIQMNLRPSILDDLGILATIGWFCRQYKSTYSAIHVKQEIHIEEQEVSDSLKTVIFRVLQEAMNNVAKHSKASAVLLSLRKADQAIQLVVRDNGRGFVVEDILSRKGSSRGLGLDSMRERTELSGGKFTVESTDSGTVIQASWPL
jgi:signal transduction histidine kinase